MTTHYMDEAEFCDRIAIMDQGRIVVLDTPEALKAQRRRRPGADRDRRRRRGDRRAARALRHRGAGRPRARSRSTSPPARSSCRACSPSWACRSARSASRARRSTTSSCPTPARRSATPRSPGGKHGQPHDRCRRWAGPAMSADRAAGRPRRRAAPDVIRVTRAAAQLAQRAARDQDRLAARADPLPQRPDADRHLARPAAAVPVRARLGPAAALARPAPTASTSRPSSTPGVLCISVMFTAMFSAASIVWDREFGFLREMMVAPMPAQLDRHRQVPRRRHGREPARA